MATYFPGFPPFTITPRPGFKRPPHNSPGHIAVVSSPFLQNNLVKLKSPRPPQYVSNKKSQVILNLIKRKQEPISESEKHVSDLAITPLSFQVKSRKKRWIPFNPLFPDPSQARSAQMPQQDNFLSFINKRPEPEPFNQRVPLESSPQLGVDPPIKSVTAESLLTKISPVPFRPFQMHGSPSQQQRRVPTTFRNQRPTQSQMELNHSPSLVSSPSQVQNEPENNGAQPPYWLNPVYLAAILAQNNRPPYLVLNNGNSAPASVSTSCGPRGCSAAAAAGSAASTSSSAGASVSGSPPSRPPSRPTTRPTVRPTAITTQRPTDEFEDVGDNRPATGSNTDSSSTSSSGPQNVNNNGRNLKFDFRRKRAPAEATSLQAMLAQHKIDTNVLKTRSQLQPALPKYNYEAILTPQNNPGYQQQRFTGIRAQNQKPLPENFYTNSDIFPQFNGPSPTEDTPQQVISERQDLGDPEPKKTSFRETAIIALKLSQSIMNLYKTVAPYLEGGE